MKFLLKNGKIILIVLIILAAYGIIMYIKRIKKEDFTTIDYKQKYEDVLAKYIYKDRDDSSEGAINMIHLRNNTTSLLNIIGLSDKQKYIFINDADIKFKHILNTENIQNEDEDFEIYEAKIILIMYMMLLESQTSFKNFSVDDNFKLLKIMNTYKPNQDINTFLSDIGIEIKDKVDSAYNDYFKSVLESINNNNYYHCNRIQNSYDVYDCNTLVDSNKYKFKNNFSILLILISQNYNSDMFKEKLDTLVLEDSDTEKLIKEEEAQSDAQAAAADSQAELKAQREAEEALKREQEAETQKLIAQQKAEEEAKKAEEEAKKAEEEAKKAEEEAEKATTDQERSEAQRNVEEAKRKAEEARTKVDEANQALEDKEPTQNLEDIKCDWIPIGDTPFQCVNDCIKSGKSYGCNAQDCIKSCQTCKKAENCKWLYKINFSEAKRKQPNIGLNVNECKFKPYGENINQCINECSQRSDKINYGGSNCDRVSCSDLCFNCDDEDWCSWKTRKDGAPNSTILFGNNTSIGNLNQFTLYWDDIDTTNYYIVVSYERDNPDKTLNIEKILNKDPNQVTGKIEYNVKDIKNNIHYNFYILCVNDHGLSLPSNEITLKISQIINNNNNNGQPGSLQTNQQNQAEMCKFQQEVTLSNTALDMFKGQNFNLNLR
jgi:hypothetical protein